jgi:Na+-translocating ferredoxin:NAD+ oxidoreductase RnfE subunit
MTDVRHRIADGLAYGASMFGVGFVLGAVRQLLVLPRTGLTVALAIEVPLIVVTSAFVARWIRRRHPLSREGFGCIVTGLVGLLTLLFAEEILSRILNGRSVFAVWADFPMTSSIINAVGLALFTLMPWIVARAGSGLRARK